MAKREKRGLGRGLSALMADIEPAPSESPAGVSNAPGETNVPIELVAPNPDQPRRRFSQEALDELAASVREKGIIQPLIVRPDPGQSGHYQIVAGERRWRAAQQAKFHEVPVLIREFDDTEILEVAIIENIQRADLNAMEEAAGYRQLTDRFGHTQEKLAEAMGKSRSHIANMLRLLSLPDEVQDMLRDGRLSAGHARALITSDRAVALAREIVKNGLSVREAEKLAKKKPSTARGQVRAKKDADTAALEQSLSATLKMQVSVEHDPGTGGGRVSIRYQDLGQLDDLVRALGG